MGFTMREGGFTVSDYVAFGILCIASCAGGIWYSAIGSRTKAVVDIRDYLLGGRHMSTFPVSLSLIASYVSGVTILGTPAEIYNYGLQYWLIVVAIFISCVIVSVIYMPVFCLLGLSSSYEVLFLPMVVYVPALAFNQLTGFNVFAVAAVMVVICGIYTVLGGLKAVVWTDSVQTGIMFIGVLLVAVAGTVAVGGVTNVHEIAQRTGRFDLSNWSFSPYERQTGWGAIVGGTLYWTCFNSVNQTMVQRYISLSTYKKAVQALAIFCFGAIIAICLCVWCGLTAWAAWTLGGCDPHGVPIVDDRLLPAFVTYVSKVQHLPGLSGVFLAGVFGAGLSSLSAVLNACALVGVEDIMRGWLRLQLKPLVEGIIARLISAVLAVVSVVMLIVIEKLGGVLGVATALSAIAASTSCGIFTLGMVCWWVGPKGAISGAFAGALVAGTISLGTQAAAAEGLRVPPLNFSATCPHNLTFKLLKMNVDPETVFPLFRISYHWIAPLGLLATITVGAIVGWLFDKKASLRTDLELFTPLIWRCLPQEYHDKGGETRRQIAAKDLLRSGQVASTPLIETKPEGKVNNTEIEINGEVPQKS
ncbi:sodium-coupled monocarboxylate transporter 2-like isoform X2 [Hyposmocoma kahamanoa]|uniref:sodium-coupled monocarboxylate transporter 2-like isoform X2 n=1 Tax=Hyposmocoma kahamanoa TaxID=1477025 RepID=UPI000E6D7E1F|nr:sodium-coupled monocarboxylate transporter 2-like isoform X2 [Hyposmocoma kahamanoa]